MVAVATESISWMLARLERETREHHAKAEADLYRVLDEPTLDGYRRWLATIYHFEYAVEAALVHVPDLPLRFVATRLRSGALGDDLLALGTSAATMPVLGRPAAPPRLASAPEALGWIYVIQRNTLHHAAVFRALAPRLRASLHGASRYLTAFATNVHQRWRELGAHLDHGASTPARGQLIALAAHDAFACQHRAFSCGAREALQ